MFTFAIVYRLLGNLIAILVLSRKQTLSEYENLG